MAWEHLSITKPHLVYIILGGFTSLFMLCSSIIKERMYIGEATVATICGLIFGPHAANLINPQSWGSVDIVTIEFSRIVLVVQCFAVGVELPKFYMERHWKSVIFLLVPVMTFGWLVTSLFVWWMIPPLNWLDSLVIAACVTATDPVLASSVVGKGKFAKRVPKHLRDLLSAESGCNDGMAFPFIYLSLYLIQDNRNAGKVSFHWIVYTILYECIFGAVYGFLIGYIARHGIKFAERHDLIDRESFLVFYFVLALFCAGSGSILGVDDLLVGFSAGVGFSNDGWFGQKTEESHVSNVIDLLLNLTYFVYLGTIIPWEMFNDTSIGLSAWRLTIIAIFVILFRRIPIMMALKPLIPDIKTWREALFAGHFGPIGVGAIFVAIMARAELEADEPVPLSELPPASHPHYTLLTLVWPIVTFLVVASIIVHGSSIAVFTLGKRINTLTLTMSYTTAPEDGPSWMSRLPRISSQSRSEARTMSDTDLDDLKTNGQDIPPGSLAPGTLPLSLPGHFLRRIRDEDGPSHHGSRASSHAARRRRKHWDDGIGPGGPISKSAIYPQRRSTQPAQPATSLPSGLSSVSAPSATDESPSSEGQPDQLATSTSSPALLAPELHGDKNATSGATGLNEKEGFPANDSPADGSSSPASGSKNLEVYDEGDNYIIENEDGDVVDVQPTGSTPDRDGSGNDGDDDGDEDHKKNGPDMERLARKLTAEAEKAGSGASNWTYGGIKKKLGEWKNEEIQKRKEKQKDGRRHEPARAYHIGNTIIVEDEDGEVVKKYELPSQNPDKEGIDMVAQGLKYMGMGGLIKKVEPKAAADGGGGGGEAAAVPRQRRKSVANADEEEDDRHIRFTIGGVGQRMTKEGFIQEMQKLDQNTRQEVVNTSSASNAIKSLARQDAGAELPNIVVSHHPDRGKAKAIEKPGSGGGGAGSSTGAAAAGGRRQQRRAAAVDGVSDSDSDMSGGGRRRRQQRRSSSSSSRSRSSSSRPARAVRGRSGSQVTRPAAASAAATAAASGEDPPETAVELRRRLAALGVADSDEDGGDYTKETPAERRRREAALGMSGQPGDDSDDDNTPRVVPVRRGIRFTPDVRGG